MSKPALKLADVASDLIKSGHVWYGNPEQCQDIYLDWCKRIRKKPTRHPLNQIIAVLVALSKSKDWNRTGYIEHLGRRHSVYERKLWSTERAKRIKELE